MRCWRSHGFFPVADDVFQLSHYELEAAIIDLMTAWSTALRRAARPLARYCAGTQSCNRGMGEAGHAAGARPVPDIIDDPAIVMLWGITRESLDKWLSAGAGANSNEIQAAWQRRMG